MTLAKELRRQNTVGRSHIVGKGVGSALCRRLHRLLVRDSLLNGVLWAGIARRGLLNRRLLDWGSGNLLRIALHLPGHVSNGRLRDRLGLHLSLIHI